MSDIGILNNPADLVMIALVLGSPGLLLGAIAGALDGENTVGPARCSARS